MTTATGQDITNTFRAPRRLGDQLPALQPRTPRPGLPNPNHIRPHDPVLADLLTDISQADADAMRAAMTYQATLPGGDHFRAVLAEDAEWVTKHLDAGKDIPDTAGPLYEHLTSGQHQAFVQASRAQVRSDWLDHQLRNHPNLPTLQKTLDVEADELRDQIQGLLTRARDRKQRRLYDEALELCATWAEVSALHEWATDPTKALRHRSPHSMPAELGMLEHEAAMALGEERVEVPLESLKLDGAPPAATARPRQPQVVIDGGDTVHWSKPPPSNPYQGG